MSEPTPERVEGFTFANMEKLERYAVELVGDDLRKICVILINAGMLAAYQAGYDVPTLLHGMAESYRKLEPTLKDAEARRREDVKADG